MEIHRLQEDRIMFGPYTYLVFMLIFLGIPIIYFWVRCYSLLARNREIFFQIVPVALVFGIAWDIFAVKNGVWTFRNVTDVWFLGLPVEEWIFFILYSIAIASAALFFIKDVKK